VSNLRDHGGRSASFEPACAVLPQRDRAESSNRYALACLSFGVIRGAIALVDAFWKFGKWQGFWV
jgi:hypothetical protein